MITSLNIVAKTFTSIAKTFAGLSVTIVAKGRRLVLILHLKAKYAKMNCKSQLWQKVNGQSKSTVNGQQMMSPR